MRRITVVLVLSAMVGMIPRPSPAQTEGAPCPDEPTDQAITYGQVVTCTIGTVGDNDVFRFMAVGNERVIIQVTRIGGAGSGFEPCIDLLTPTPPGQITACNVSLFNRIIVTLNEPGLHTIRVRERDNGSTGAYALTIERLIPAGDGALSIQYGETLADRIDPAGDLAIFRFAGAAGSNVAITASRVGGAGSGFEPCIDLFRPDSGRTTVCVASASNALQMVLPQTGVYTVLVDEFGSNGIGDYNLTLDCLSPQCVGPYQSLTIPATALWVDTGIDLALGQSVGLRASAQWRADPGQALVGPMGHAGACGPESSGCPIPANHAALVGRIGGQPPFLVGEGFAFLAPAAGRLYLMINDDVDALEDNSGAATVHVLYSSPPLGVDPPIPASFDEMLGAPEPNPFADSAELRFRVWERGPVSLRVYDLTGRMVRALHDRVPLEVGEHLARWDGQGDDGRRVAAGVYFYRLDVAGRSQTRRAIVLQ